MKLAIWYLLVILDFLFVPSSAKSIKNSVTLDFIMSKINKSTHFYDFSTINPSPQVNDFILEKAHKALNSFDKNHQIKLYMFLMSNETKFSIKDFTENLSEKFKIEKSSLVIVIFSTLNKNCEFYLGSEVNHLLLPDDIKNLEKKITAELSIGGANYVAYYFIKQLIKKIKVKERKIQNLNLKHNTKVLSDMVKSIVLLPIIIFFCYFMCCSKDKKIHKKKKHFYLDKLKEFKGILKKQDLAEKTCIICLEDFIPVEKKTEISEATILKVKGEYGNDKLLKLECGHCFHPMCINKWIDKQKSCPTCRHGIKVKNIQLYKLEE